MSDEKIHVREFRECKFHDEEANKYCHNPEDHHLLKYHDPQSDCYIGDDCVNCIGSFLQKRWESHYLP